MSDMMEKKFGWCLEQQNGIELIEPNENLSEAGALNG